MSSQEDLVPTRTRLNGLREGPSAPVYRLGNWGLRGHPSSAGTQFGEGEHLVQACSVEFEPVSPLPPNPRLPEGKAGARSVC